MNAKKYLKGHGFNSQELADIVEHYVNLKSKELLNPDTKITRFKEIYAQTSQSKEEIDEVLFAANLLGIGVEYNSITNGANIITGIFDNDASKPGNFTTEAFRKAIEEGMKPEEDIEEAEFYKWRKDHFRRTLWSDKFEHEGPIKGRFTIEQLKQLWQADPEMEAVRDYSDHHPDVDFAKTMDEMDEGMKIQILEPLSDEDKKLFKIEFSKLNGTYEPKPFPISEEDFYNKEYCDTLRFMIVKSCILVDEATLLLEGSKDLSRDASVSMKLRDAGIGPKQVLHTIRILNS
jgi:hypothetical protein